MSEFNINYSEIVSELNKITEILYHTRDNTWGFRFDKLTDYADRHIREIRRLVDEMQQAENRYKNSEQQLNDEISRLNKETS